MNIERMKSYVAVVLAVGVVAVLASGPVMSQFETGEVSPAATGNAHRVDGFHAVGAGASKAQRAGRLVATSGTGHLPNNIIKKANNANLLDGVDSTKFARRSALSNYVKKTGLFPYARYDVLGNNGGAVNQAGNPVHWKQLKGVPSTIADGFDQGYSSGIQSFPILAKNAEVTIVWGFHKSVQPIFQIIPINDLGWFTIVKTDYVRDGNDVNNQITVKNLGNASAYKIRWVAFNSGVAIASADGSSSKKVGKPWVKKRSR